MKICSHTSTDHVIKEVQGDSGGKVNIFGGDSTGRCEKESSHEHVSNSEW
jgi:hypothetical protein